MAGHTPPYSLGHRGQTGKKLLGWDWQDTRTLVMGLQQDTVLSLGRLTVGQNMATCPWPDTGGGRTDRGRELRSQEGREDHSERKETPGREEQ